MSSHVDGHPRGQAVCDALLEELRFRAPDVLRKECKNVCTFHCEGGANFAYAYHTKTKHRLKVYFPSTAVDQFAADPSVMPILRKKVKPGWSARFAWYFFVDQTEAAAFAAQFLLRLPGRMASQDFPQLALLAEEVPEDWQHFEGAVSQILVNRYERDSGARNACLRIHGTRCAGCDFDFGESYGPNFAGLVTVHHLIPLSQVRGEYTVNPSVDLVPLCANCHLVVHQRLPPFSVEELRSFLAPKSADCDAG